MQPAELIRAVHILKREGWPAEKILSFILEVSGDAPAQPIPPAAADEGDSPVG